MLPFLNSLSILFSCDMNTFFHRSNGQGNLHSKMTNRIFSNGPSIVSRLISRSITGQSLNLKVHEHYGLRLHLVWRTHKHDDSSERCMERYFFLYEELETFCRGLKFGAMEGLCDCVFMGLYRFLEGKADICFKRPILHSEINIPRSLLKCYQEDLSLSPCNCPVSSSHWLECDKKCSSTCVRVVVMPLTLSTVPSLHIKQEIHPVFLFIIT